MAWISVISFVITVLLIFFKYSCRFCHWHCLTYLWSFFCESVVQFWHIPLFWTWNLTFSSLSHFDSSAELVSSPRATLDNLRSDDRDSCSCDTVWAWDHGDILRPNGCRSHHNCSIWNNFKWHTLQNISCWSSQGISFFVMETQSLKKVGHATS